PAHAVGGLRILVAEDNLVNARLAERMLRNCGYTVKIVGDGAQAVTAFESDHFDLILMDIQMPNMDGREATMAIRAREQASGSKIPIIAVTAHAMVGDREQCLIAGMDDYITKPVDRKELLACIERTLKVPATTLGPDNGVRKSA